MRGSLALAGAAALVAAAAQPPVRGADQWKGSGGTGRFPQRALAAQPAAAQRTAAQPTAARTPNRQIRLGEYFYAPKVVTVRFGQKVRFVNAGRIPHTVADTSKAGAIRARAIKPRPLAHGQSQVVSFARPGLVYYLCTFHPTLMRGRIVVEN